MVKGNKHLIYEQIEPDWSYVYPQSNFALYDGHRLPNGKFVSELDTDKWQEI